MAIAMPDACCQSYLGVSALKPIEGWDLRHLHYDSEASKCQDYRLLSSERHDRVEARRQYPFECTCDIILDSWMHMEVKSTLDRSMIPIAKERKLFIVDVCSTRG